MIRRGGASTQISWHPSRWSSHLRPWPSSGAALHRLTLAARGEDLERSPALERGRPDSLERRAIRESLEHRNCSERRRRAAAAHDARALGLAPAVGRDSRQRSPPGATRGVERRRRIGETQAPDALTRFAVGKWPSSDAYDTSRASRTRATRPGSPARVSSARRVRFIRVSRPRARTSLALSTSTPRCRPTIEAARRREGARPTPKRSSMAPIPTPGGASADSATF